MGHVACHFLGVLAIENVWHVRRSEHLLKTAIAGVPLCTSRMDVPLSYAQCIRKNTTNHTRNDQRMGHVGCHFLGVLAIKNVWHAA